MIDFNEKLIQIRNAIAIITVASIPYFVFVSPLSPVPFMILGIGMTGIAHTVRFIMNRYVKYCEEKYADVDYEEILNSLDEPESNAEP